MVGIAALWYALNVGLLALCFEFYGLLLGPSNAIQRHTTGILLAIAYSFSEQNACTVLDTELWGPKRCNCEIVGLYVE